MKKVEAAETIAGAFDDWLKAEVITSGEGRNRYLNPAGETPEEAQKKFDKLKAMLAMPFDDENNWNSQKHKGHVMQRVPHWMVAFETSVGEHNEDFYAARASFAPLMTTSGSHRVACYLEAQSPEEYLAMRALGTGIDLEKAVSEEITDKVPAVDFSAAEVTFSGLMAAFFEAYGQTGKFFRTMGDRLSNDFSEENIALSVEDMKQSQISHIKLATHCVIMAAKLRRGDLTAVPFLEPLSISDQSGKVYFPLNEPIDWLAVLEDRR